MQLWNISKRSLGFVASISWDIKSWKGQSLYLGWKRPKLTENSWFFPKHIRQLKTAEKAAGRKSKRHGAYRDRGDLNVFSPVVMQQDALDRSSATVGAKLAKAEYGLVDQCKIPRVRERAEFTPFPQTLPDSHGTDYWVPPAITSSFTFGLSDIASFPVLLPHASWDHLSKTVVAPKPLWVSTWVGAPKWRQASIIQVYVYVYWYISFIYIWLLDWEEKVIFICIFLSRAVVKTTTMV